MHNSLKEDLQSTDTLNNYIPKMKINKDIFYNIKI